MYCTGLDYSLYLSTVVYSKEAISYGVLTAEQFTRNLICSHRNLSQVVSTITYARITLLSTKTFAIAVGLTCLFHDCVRRERATGCPHNSTGN